MPAPAKTQKQPAKKGGMFMEDLNKLAVPFGILLAERGLNKMLKEDKKAPKASSKKPSAASATETNRKVAVGGKKTTKKAQKGGDTGASKLVSEMNKLSGEIEHFLAKW